MIVFFI